MTGRFGERHAASAPSSTRDGAEIEPVPSLVFRVADVPDDMVTEILVPLDGSPLSRKALDVALSENPDATVTVLHVIDPAEPGYSYYPFDSTAELDAEPRHGSAEWYEKAEAFADELFEDVRASAVEYDADVETELAVGDPSRVIVDVADERGFDHVILGSHGRDENSRVLVGSVTESVAYRSPVRVTLVR